MLMGREGGGGTVAGGGGGRRGSGQKAVGMCVSGKIEGALF